MRIELLHFKGCPGSAETLSILEKTLAEEGLSGEVIPVTLGPEARSNFSGSPTILVDGEDLFPIEERPSAINCRIYATPEGPKNYPTAAMVREALRATLANHLFEECPKVQRPANLRH